MKLALEIAGSILGLVVVIGGYFVWAGMPPYKTEKDHARDYRVLEVEVVGGQAQFYEYQQFILRKDIRNLEQQKREMLKNVSEEKEWFKFYEEELQELKESQKKNQKTIDKYEKRLEKNK